MEAIVLFRAPLVLFFSKQLGNEAVVTSYPGPQAQDTIFFCCFIDDDITFIRMFSMCIILQLVSRK